MSPMKPRRDPAPSVIKYRLQRLWLTPSFRRMSALAPLVLVVGVGVTYVLKSPDFRSQMAQAATDIRDAFVSREEFKVSTVEISGASDALRQKVAAVLDFNLPISSLDLDVAEVRTKIEGLSNVSGAAVRVGKGGILQIDLTERVPVALWRSGGALKLLDLDGVVLGDAETRLDGGELPLILGAGARENVAEALDLIAIAGPIAERIRGLQRVGSRRWTIVLDLDQEIFLPENGARAALRRVMALHHVENVFEKDIRVIDMRDGKKPVLRLGSFANSEIRRIKATLRDSDQ